MENSFERLHQVIEYLKDNGKIHKQQDIADKMNLGKSQISEALKGKKSKFTEGFLRRFAEAYKEYISESWLLTGKGEMVVPENDQHPMLEDTAAAGFNVGMPLNDLSSNALPQIPLVPDFDFYIKVSGRSMEPVLLDGDILACRIVSDRANIPYGHICVVCSNDAFLVKYLLPSSDNSDSSDYPDSETITLHSANPDYPDIILPCSEVFRVALVVGLIRPSLPSLR